MSDERRLNFVLNKNAETPTYQVFNRSKGELLGFIRKERVGQWLHWCFCYHKELFTKFPDVDYYSLSPGCHDEIREFSKNPEKYLSKYANS